MPFIPFIHIDNNYVIMHINTVIEYRVMILYSISIEIQWNLSILDTLGSRRFVHIIEDSLIYRYLVCANIYNYVFYTKYKIIIVV